jgi:hypothetical protein
MNSRPTNLFFLMIFPWLLNSQDETTLQYSIIQHPLSKTVCLGEAAIFSVKIAIYKEVSSNPDTTSQSIDYQWQVSNDVISWSNVNGEKKPTFTLTESVQPAHNSAFIRAIIKTPYQELVSEPATLFVESGITFTKHPTNVQVVVGGMAVFQAEATLDSKNGTPAYQWQYCELGTATWQNWRGENMAQMIVNPDGGYKGLYVRLAARPTGGCAEQYSNKALLSVLTTPEVKVVPASKTFCGGGDALFSVRLLGGSGKEKIQWQISKNGGKSFENIKKSTDFQYKLTKITPEMSSWQYRAAVSVPGEKIVYTDPSIITVHGEVGFKQQPLPKVVCFGENAIFEIKAKYEGQMPEFQWKSSTDGVNFIDLPNENTMRLVINADSSKMVDTYYQVTMTAGECQSFNSETARLSMIKEVIFSLHPVDISINSEVKEVVFIADYEGESKNYNESWEMSYNDGATWVPVPKCKGKKLTIVNPTLVQNGMCYRMKLLNRACGKIVFSEKARLEVK